MTNEPQTPQNLDLSSLKSDDIHRAKLKSLFPSVFSETYNEKGELIESIDWEKLKAELGIFSEVFEKRKERYGMEWPGKKSALKLSQKPSYATLKPCREESVNFDNTENLFMEGDNLEVLKLLQKSYYGKVKMIYIDPPYNTGKEFIYPDNYTENLDTYLTYSGLIDSEGKKFSTNTVNEGRFHTKWLNMMYPRLYLARNLLREDGVIFISIDDNEVKNLRTLCDEIFGEENFFADMIVIRAEGGGLAKKVIKGHDNLLVYVKSNNSFKGIFRPKDIRGEVIFVNNREYWIEEDWLRKEFGKYGTCLYEEIETIKGIKKKEEIDQGLKKGIYKLIPKGNNTHIVGRLRALDEDGSRFYSILKHLNKNGISDLEKLNFNQYFDFPKPVSLVKELILGASFFTKLNNDIILDFFSGSSTTAQAVLDLNKEDGGNRKFIMVQLPEPCQENSEAFKNGYKTIADIGKERIRRVIEKIKTELIENEPKIPGMEAEKPELDLGFKVFKLDSSNFKTWESPHSEISKEELIKQLELQINHIKPTASQEDILFELLLKSGLRLTEKIATLTIANKTVYSLAENSLLICLENEITNELIEGIADRKPTQFICLDQGFQGNDQLKVNAVETFTNKTKSIIFKTV